MTSPPRQKRETYLLYRWSGVSRPVDPRYPTNRVVLAVLPVLLIVGLGWSVRDGAGWGSGALAGVNLSLAGFFAWGWTRELTPDQDRLSFLAIPMVVVVWAIAGNQRILEPVFGMMAVRFVNRSTGKASELLDTVNTTIVMMLVAWLIDGTLVAVVGIALILDAVLPANRGQPDRRYHIVPGALLLALGILRFPFAPAPPNNIVDWALVLIVVTAALAAVTLPRPTALGDVDGTALHRLRVRAGALLGVGTVAFFMLSGQEWLSFGVGWSAIATLALGAPVRLLGSAQRS